VNVREGFALACAAAGIAYLAFAGSRVRRFGHARGAAASETPPVTILKPLHGIEEGLYENLRSFCEQDYSAFSVVCGAQSPADPALEVAERLAAHYRERLEIVVGTGESSTGNPKIANLAALAARARGEIVVIADADMRVGTDYLRSIVAPFADARVGAVTCLYRAGAGRGIFSALAAMHINEEFAPSVLVAGALEEMDYCFGATIAVRRDVLEAIGGFAALRGHVADDYLLGKLVRERGLKIVLSRYVVENVVYEPSFASLASRELRWMRTIRSVRPLGFALSFLTCGLPLALLGAALTSNPGLRFGFAAIGASLRLSLHADTQRALGVRRPPPAWLIPLREALTVTLWIAAFFDRNVTWREQRLRLDDAGNIRD
jgi:ceramide glucosyltransferase